jgi:type II secretory pathway component GspD/PulD (secretin)
MWLAFAAFSCCVTTSCVADPDFVSGAEKAALMEAYQSQSDAVAQTREAREQAALKHLSIDPGESGGQPLLSVDLVQADFNRVMERILASPLVEYGAQPRRFKHRVSARFSDRLLADGLNVLLDGSGLIATWENGLLSVRSAPFSAATQSRLGDSLVSRELVLSHLSAPDTVDLITRLFGSDEDEESGGLTVGSLPELNAVYVSGASSAVEDAVSVIQQADRPVAHVIIEALVVKIDTSSVESMTVNFSDGAAGKFDLTTLIPNQTGGNIVASFSDLAANSAAITATIDFLAAQNAAEILARPYVATRSSKQATLAIVDDQFARVDTSGDDSSIITTDSITAGITMDITPLVMADQSIRVDISLEDSRFTATAGDIIIAKQRSTAATSMIVQSGQTIVIGGLNSRYRLTDRSGLPWLRHVPVLNLFASDQAAVESREELVVYVTPYIWVPGLETPLPLPGHPVPELPKLLSVENGGRAVD